MFEATLIGDVILVSAGIAAGVIYEAKIKGWYMGAEAYAAKLRAKADAITAAAKKV